MVKNKAISLSVDAVGIAGVARFADAPPGKRPQDLLPNAKSVVVFGIKILNDDSLDWPDADYYNGYFSRYLKAVVEEYCRLPLFRREEIYFHEFIETIESAIASARMIRVEMVNPMTGHGTWDVRPFGIHPNASHLYHYLIGKSVEAGGLRRDEKIASIRLCRIRKLTVLSKKTTQRYKELGFNLNLTPWDWFSFRTSYTRFFGDYEGYRAYAAGSVQW